MIVIRDYHFFHVRYLSRTSGNQMLGLDVGQSVRIVQRGHREGTAEYRNKNRYKIEGTGGVLVMNGSK